MGLFQVRCCLVGSAERILGPDVRPHVLVVIVSAQHVIAGHRVGVLVSALSVTAEPRTVAEFVVAAESVSAANTAAGPAADSAAVGA